MYSKIQCTTFYFTFTKSYTDAYQPNVAQKYAYEWAPVDMLQLCAESYPGTYGKGK